MHVPRPWLQRWVLLPVLVSVAAFPARGDDARKSHPTLNSITATKTSWSPGATAWFDRCDEILAQWSNSHFKVFRDLEKAAHAALKDSPDPDVILAVSDVTAAFSMDPQVLRGARRFIEFLPDAPAFAKLSKREQAVVLHNVATVMMMDTDRGKDEKRLAEYADRSLALLRESPADTEALFHALRLSIDCRASEGRQEEATALAREFMTLAQGPQSPELMLTSVLTEGGSENCLVVIKGLPECVSSSKVTSWALAQKAPPTAPAPAGDENTEGSDDPLIRAKVSDDTFAATLVGYITVLRNGSNEQAAAPHTGRRTPETVRSHDQKIWEKATALVTLAIMLPVDPATILDPEVVKDAEKPSPFKQNLPFGMRLSLSDMLDGEEGDLLRSLSDTFLWRCQLAGAPPMFEGARLDSLDELLGAPDYAAEWRAWLRTHLSGNVRAARARLFQNKEAAHESEEKLIEALAVIADGPGAVGSNGLGDALKASPVVAKLLDAIRRQRAEATPLALELLKAYLATHPKAPRALPPNTLIVGLPEEIEMNLGTHCVWLVQTDANGKASGFKSARVGAVAPLSGRLQILASTAPTSSTDAANLRLLGTNLFNLLFPGEIAGRILAADQVLFVTSGGWATFPLGILVAPSPDGPRFFGELKNWSITESAWSTARHQQEPSKAKAAAFVGGIGNFKGMTGHWAPGNSSYQFADLPLAPEEAQWVAEKMGVGVQPPATLGEQNVRDALRSSKLVHLATHGLGSSTDLLSVNRQQEVDSYLSDVRSTGYPGLVLQPDAQATSHDGDGFLQAWELDREGSFAADLVTLSACNLGQRFGESASFPELPRALLDGGVRSVQACRWQVDDQSVGLFMHTFYNALSANKSVAEANRLAVAELIHDGKHSHPYFWAGFGIFGDGATRLH